MKSINGMALLMSILMCITTIQSFANTPKSTATTGVTSSSTISLEEAGYQLIGDINQLQEFLEPEPIDLVPTFPFDVKCGKLNVRSGPSIDDEIVDAYYRGTQFICSDVKGDWYKTPDGWVHSEYLQPAFRFNVHSIDEVYRPKTELVTAINKPSGLNEDQIRTLLQGTKMVDLAPAFAKYEEEYSVNVLFAIAVARQESGGGTSRKARKENNLFGIMSGKKYSSKAENIKAFNSLIRRRYINKGLTTLYAIGPVYCTEGTSGWLNGIGGMMKTLEAKARALQ